MGKLQLEVKALECLDLFQMRASWAEQFGPAPRFQSVELFRLMLAWRIQETVMGGLDPITTKELATSGSAVIERMDIAVGATIRRQWQNQEVVVYVVDKGFLWNDTVFPSLSAVATAVTGTHWNGPKFFGLRP